MHCDPAPGAAVCNRRQADGYPEFRELRYDFGDVTVVVQDVPVIVCDDCDEVFVAGELGVALGDIVEQVAEATRLVAKAHQPPDAPLETVWRLPRVERDQLLATA